MEKIKAGRMSNSKFQDRLSTGFVCLLITVYLLSCPGGGYEEIAVWKYRLFLLLTLSYIGISVLGQVEFWLITPHAGLRGKRKFRFEPAYLTVAYLGFTAVSALLSKYPGTFWGNGRKEGLFTIGIYVGIFLLLRRYFRPRKWLLFVFGATVSLFCLLGLLQFTGANPLGLYPEGHNFYGAGIYYPGQYWSTIGNMNLCAALLSLASGLFTAACIRGRNARDWLLLIPLCLSVFSIFALDSEAGMSALLGGLILLPPFVVRKGTHLKNLMTAYGSILLSMAAGKTILFYDGGVRIAPGRLSWILAGAGMLLLLAGLALRYWKDGKEPSPEKLRKCLAAVSVSLVLTGFLVVYLHPSLPDGFLQQAHEVLHGHWDDSFGSGRLYIWRQAFSLIPEAPLFGGGPDTLAFRGLEGFSRYNETLDQMVYSYIDAAHNEYLNILVNQGLLAFLAYGAFLCALVCRWWKQSKHDCAALGGGSALFYLLQAFFNISMCLTTPYLWIALAVLDNKNIIRREDET